MKEHNKEPKMKSEKACIRLHQRPGKWYYTKLYAGYFLHLKIYLLGCKNLFIAMISLLSSPSPHLLTLRSVNYDTIVLPVFESQMMAKKPKGENGKSRMIGSKKLVVVAE